jgi:aryl-alcohol dehydrogenase-like predicted oxidoreductase
LRRTLPHRAHRAAHLPTRRDDGGSDAWRSKLSGVERRELAPGYEVARAINGGWQLAADHGANRRAAGEVVDDLLQLAEAGFTTFDGADIYLGVEELFGALQRRWRALGRALDALQIHTKYVPDRSSLAAVDRRAVERAIDRSLSRLGAERLDLVQFHWWDFEVAGWIEAASALDALHRAGKIRAVGVTNFDTVHLTALLDAGVAVVSNQVQYSLLDRRPERAMSALCAERDIHLLCYGSLAGGLLSERWLGREAPQVGAMANRSLTKYRLIVDEAGGWVAYQGLLAALAVVARRHRVSAANVAARWVLDRPAVGAVILGAPSGSGDPLADPGASHLEENRRLFEFELEPEDRAAIDRALEACPSPPGDPYELERRPGGRHAAILRTEQHAAGGER